MSRYEIAVDTGDRVEVVAIADSLAEAVVMRLKLDDTSDAVHIVRPVRHEPSEYVTVKRAEYEVMLGWARELAGMPTTDVTLSQDELRKVIVCIDYMAKNIKGGTVVDDMREQLTELASTLRDRGRQVMFDRQDAITKQVYSE